jgi:hypothetical protein
VYLENKNVNVKNYFRNDAFAKRCCFPTYKLVSSRVHAAIPRVDFPGESAASAALSASMLGERRLLKYLVGHGVDGAGMGWRRVGIVVIVWRGGCAPGREGGGDGGIKAGG